jgi:hypothetical protein
MLAVCIFATRTLFCNLIFVRAAPIADVHSCCSFYASCHTGMCRTPFFSGSRHAVGGHPLKDGLCPLSRC